MTAENPADAVTEQAAKVITACIGPDRKWADCTPLLFARALHDAGLLADPADRDRCHVVGCVEHIDGMHVDQVGDAIVHVGCPACRPLADPADQDEPTELDRFIGAISDPLYLQGYLQGYQNGYKHAEAERDEIQAVITDAGLETYTPDGSERVAAHLTEQQRIITRLRAERHRAEADLAALRNRIGSIAGVLRCVDAPAASMIQDALDGGDPK